MNMIETNFLFIKQYVLLFLSFTNFDLAFLLPKHISWRFDSIRKTFGLLLKMIYFCVLIFWKGFLVTGLGG